MLRYFFATCSYSGTNLEDVLLGKAAVALKRANMSKRIAPDPPDLVFHFQHSMRTERIPAAWETTLRTVAG